MTERRQRELALVQSRYGEVEVGPNIDWIIIKHFPLPPGWNKPETSILIQIPSAYPTVPPDCFWADQDLRPAGGGMPGNAQVQPQIGRQWVWFSYHVRAGDWKPHAEPEQGHNILSFIAGVARRLSEAT